MKCYNEIYLEFEDRIAAKAIFVGRISSCLRWLHAVYWLCFILGTVIGIRSMGCSRGGVRSHCPECLVTLHGKCYVGIIYLQILQIINKIKVQKNGNLKVTLKVFNSLVYLANSMKQFNQTNDRSQPWKPFPAISYTNLLPISIKLKFKHMWLSQS